MSKLETVETLTQKIPCPVCSNSRSIVVLAYELSKSLCDYNVACDCCRYKFIVTSDEDVMQEVWSQIGKDIARKKCPKCGDGKFHFEFLCYMNSEKFYYLIRCGVNNHYSRINQLGIQYLF